MFTLKPLSRPGIPAALQKAERYRLLNEPWEAESICRDVLAVEPDNQAALIALILSLTDQFNRELGPDPAELKALVGRLGTEYEQLYYAAIIAERHGKARLARGGPGAGAVAYAFLRDAMDLYERPSACVRRATTPHCSAGTPAPGSSCGTRACGRWPRSGWRRGWSDGARRFRCSSVRTPHLAMRRYAILQVP